MVFSPSWNAGVAAATPGEASPARVGRQGHRPEQPEGDRPSLERSGKDAAKRRAAQAQRGSLGRPAAESRRDSALTAPGAKPLRFLSLKGSGGASASILACVEPSSNLTLRSSTRVGLVGASRRRSLVPWRSASAMRELRVKVWYSLDEPYNGRSFV